MHFFPNMHVEEKSHDNIQSLFLMKADAGSALDDDTSGL